MKYVFIGGMVISYQILARLCRDGYPPTYAFGYPDSLSHRSNYCALEPLAREYNFPLQNVSDINAPECQAIIRSTSPDWLFVIGWSQLVSEEILSMSSNGALGFHMSRLPQGRGRAPVAWSLIKGLTEGWVTLQRLKPGVDNGDIIDQQCVEISKFDDAETLCARLNALAEDMFMMQLPALMSRGLHFIPQRDEEATYWAKRTPEDGEIDWALPLQELYNFVRGVTAPFPGAFSYIGKKKVVFWKIAVIEFSHTRRAGEVVGEYVEHGRQGRCGIAIAVNGGIVVGHELELDNRILTDDEMMACAEEWKGKMFGP